MYHTTNGARCVNLSTGTCATVATVNRASEPGGVTCRSSNRGHSTLVGSASPPTHTHPRHSAQWETFHTVCRQQPPSHHRGYRWEVVPPHHPTVCAPGHQPTRSTLATTEGPWRTSATRCTVAAVPLVPASELPQYPPSSDFSADAATVSSCTATTHADAAP
uniref:Peptide chain release factor 1 n=1 Tax=Lygus hesperus TaxID=30085 RepID=A0A0A9ZCU6_LYGHE